MIILKDKMIGVGIALLALFMMVINNNDLLEYTLLRALNYAIAISILVLAFVGARKGVQNTRLRLSLYIITAISGITFFITESLYTITLFLFFLGLLTLFESIHPNGYLSIVKTLFPRFIPRKIQTTILMLLKIILIALSLFIMFLGIMTLSFSN